ncbi:AidA/PixA family protein [Xenorhabdus bovienii]|uniref:Inclusion body protein n=1 Tax=Xenorhabdus bovienii str. Intermedium TaxID=1379677 RepID=A0A077QIM3_XENBV|nr:AidA/PixA family protein [Xenorhabdus bovienii]CDH33070.1 hypothetical protein XBI1_2340002 [Xenorhabdus bovienii str. Intermedium]
MAIIDVLVAFDIDGILDEYPNTSEAKPAKISSSHVHLLVIDEDTKLITDRGGDKLILKTAKPNDVIQWHSTSLSGYDSIHSVLLTKYAKLASTHYLNPPRMNITNNTRPIINNASPLTTEPQNIPGYFWSSKVSDALGVDEKFLVTLVVYNSLGKPYRNYQWECIVKLGAS